jgi:hypothetical protein
MFKRELDYGGNGPLKISPGQTITGDFFLVEADGVGDLNLSNISGLAGFENTTTILSSGQRLLFGNQRVTSITANALSSGGGWAYQC